MTPKYISFSISLIESPLIKKVLSGYVKGLEQMLAENAKTINQHEEMLDFQQEEIQMLRHDIDSLEYSLSNERCL